MIRSISDTLPRYRPGYGLSDSGWEDAQYKAALSLATGNTSYTSENPSVDSGAGASVANDAGTGFAGRLWDTVSNWGSEYLKGQVQQTIASGAVKAAPAGSVTSVSPTGAVTTISPTPKVLGYDVMELLKSPWTWAAVGLGAYLLLKKR
jgi:hypothetical protein